MRRRRTIAVLFVCEVLVASLPAGSASAAEFRIGTEHDDAPFSSFDSRGKASGFNVDLGNALCKRLKLTCTWVAMRFDDIIPALQAHQIDAALSEITVTATRSRKVLFTSPVTETGPILIVPDLSEITNDPATMRGKTIGVQRGTTHEAYARQKLGQVARVRSFQTQGQAFEALASGRIDATLCDMALGHEWLELHSGAFRFGDRPITDPDYGSVTAIALPLVSDALRQRIDAALAAMMADGSFNSLSRQYFTYSISPGTFGSPL